MPNYLFVLGNAPELAEEELTAIWPNYQISGGLIKVAEIFEGSIIDKLSENKKPGDRIVFGVSGDTVDLKEIKNELENRGFKARFILPKDDVELSSVVVAKQKVDEIYIIGDLKAKTIWVQDFEDWNKRDYGRPAVQPHVGMLPPKVARMMVNIAGGGTILDPFCGVGTILAEAQTVGANAIGADIDPCQIDRTKKNLAWLGYECPLFVADAQRISAKIAPNSIDAVITEPDLGPNTRVNDAFRSKNYEKLANLYANCLENWKKVLLPGGRVIMAMPFHIDKVKIMGYSVVSGPLPYFRPQAVVKRYIYVLELINGPH